MPGLIAMHDLGLVLLPLWCLGLIGVGLLADVFVLITLKWRNKNGFKS